MSNRLAHLQGVATAEYQRHQRASAEAIQAYLDCGAALVEAKAACGHGDWLPWLATAGVPERTAQRMMKLAAAGLKSDTVTYFGGIAATIDALPALEALTYAADLWDRTDGLGEAATTDLFTAEWTDADEAKPWEFCCPYVTGN